MLDVVVSPGKEHSAAKARPGLIDVLDKLEPQQRPTLVRGDCGFGNEPFIAELEERAQPYLFKLRQSTGVKRMLARQFARDDWSTPGPSDQGWSAVEDTSMPSGMNRLIGQDSFGLLQQLLRHTPLRERRESPTGS